MTTTVSEEMSTKRMVNKGKPCGVSGCPRGAKTMGLCAMHYNRSLNNDGDPGPAGKYPARATRSVYDRAMDKVDQSPGPDACHPWTASVTNDQRRGDAPPLPVLYAGGRANRTTKSARRVIAEEHGLIGNEEGQGRWVRMREDCDPLCCNVRHMEPTTAARAFLDRDA